MAQQFSDAARSELTAGILAGDTSFTLVDGSRFPEANAGTSPVGDGNLWFKAVLQDETGFEIVYVRTHAVATTPNTLSNVLRGQEGTTARSFAAASVIGVRLTASDMANLWATMATKAADSVTLTDAAGTATLPATAAAPVASSLQALRNNIKQAFADIGNKQATLVSGTNFKTVGGVSLLGTGDIPVGGSVNTAYTWNPDGTLATATASGVTSSYAWHADGRLNTISTPTQVATYNWNAANPQQLDGVTVTGV